MKQACLWVMGVNDLEARFGGVLLSATVLPFTDIQATMDTKKRGLVSGNFNHIDALAGPRQIHQQLEQLFTCRHG